MEKKSVDPNTFLKIIRKPSSSQLPQGKENKKTQSQIPTPPTIKQSSSRRRREWKCPDFYVKQAANIGTLLPTVSDFYDPTLDDLTRLTALNKHNSLQIKIEELSKLFAFLEHFCFLSKRNLGDSTKKIPSLLDAKKIGFIFGIKNEIVSLLYDYWLSKRTQNGNPLIRKYRKKPAQDDMSFYTTFRPRVTGRRTSTRSSSRNPKNDLSVFKMLKRLKKDFSSFSDLLSSVRKREELKREQMLFDSLIFDKKMALNCFDLKDEDLSSFYSKPSLPYEQFFKFSKFPEATASFNEHYPIDVYSYFLEQRASRKNVTKVIEDDDKEVMDEIIPVNYSKSVVFRVDSKGELCFDVFFNSEKNFFGYELLVK